MKNTIDISNLSHKAIRSFELPQSAVARWNPSIHAKDEENSINIYSTIGDYGDGTGMTAKIMSSILRKAEGDVTINLNSAGGDFFEGVAIYNLLKEYDGNVNVKIVGLAASAASVIAMAGDDIKIAESGFLMIHNAWTLAMGNKEDMRGVADMLEKFDESMASVYSQATGIELKQIKKMMAAETWISGAESVEMGFASSLLDSDATYEEKEKMPDSLKKVDSTLAKYGIPRSERRALLKDLSKPSAAEPTKPSASDLSEALKGLLSTLTKD